MSAAALEAPGVTAAGHRMLWVPAVVATGRGPAVASPRLTGHQLLVYLDLVDRAEHGSGRYSVDPAGVAARCGVTDWMVRQVLPVLAAAGLVETLAAGRGHRVRVRVIPAPARARIAVPVAAIWPFPAPAGPRWPHAVAGLAVRTLLAVLYVADHRTLSTTVPAARIAAAAGLDVREFRRGLAVLAGPGPGPGEPRAGRPTQRAGTPWLRVQARSRPRPGGEGRAQDSNRIVVDWSQLAPVARLAVVPAPAGGDLAGPPRRWGGGGADTRGEAPGCARCGHRREVDPMFDADPQEPLFPVPAPVGVRRRAQPATMTEERKAVAHRIVRGWWSRHGKGQGQSYPALLSVVVAVLANGMAESDLVMAMDVLGEQGKPISGGTIQFTLSRSSQYADRVEMARQAARRNPANYSPIL